MDCDDDDGDDAIDVVRDIMSVKWQQLRNDGAIWVDMREQLNVCCTHNVAHSVIIIIT